MKNKNSSGNEPLGKDNSNYLLEMKNSLKNIKKEVKTFKRIIRRIKEIREVPTTLESDGKTYYHLLGNRTKRTAPDTKRIYDATGYFVGEGLKSFTVLKGSKIVRDVTPSFGKLLSTKRIRKTLIKTGKLVDKGDYLEFTEDYTFKSVSAAASLIIGTSSSGGKEWRTKDGTPLDNTDGQQKLNL